MKKKDFLINVTMVDLLIVSIILIAGLILPGIRELMSTMFYIPWIYGLLCINLAIDILLLVLSKFEKAGNLIRNMVIWFLVLKLFALFMAIFVSVIIGFVK